MLEIFHLLPQIQSLSLSSLLCSGKMISTYLVNQTSLPSGFQLCLVNERRQQESKGWEDTVQDLFSLLLPVGQGSGNGCAPLPKSTTSEGQPLSHSYNYFQVLSPFLCNLLIHQAGGGFIHSWILWRTGFGSWVHEGKWEWLCTAWLNGLRVQKSYSGPVNRGPKGKIWQLRGLGQDWHPDLLHSFHLGHQGSIVFTLSWDLWIILQLSEFIWKLYGIRRADLSTPISKLRKTEFWSSSMTYSWQI